MTFKVPEQYSDIVQKIMSNLPTSQFVVDLVGEAINIACNSFKDEEDLKTRLEIGLKMSEYAKEVSQPMFFMTHLVISPIVAGLQIEEVSKLDTASNALTTALIPLGNFVTSTSFKEKWNALFTLSEADKNVTAAALMFAKEEILKAIKEGNTKTTLGYAYIEVNIRQSGMYIDHTVRKYYNEFADLILHKANF